MTQKKQLGQIDELAPEFYAGGFVNVSELKTTKPALFGMLETY